MWKSGRLSLSNKTNRVMNYHWRSFGHSARSAANEGHDHAVAAVIRKLSLTGNDPQQDHATEPASLSDTSEHWSFLRVEEGHLSRKLAFECGHSDAHKHRDSQ